MHKNTRIIVLTSAAACLSACSTVKLPDFDMPGLAKFKEASAKLVEGYPEVSEAPVRPTDLRSSAKWDTAANALIAQRDGFNVPETAGLQDAPETPEDFDREVEALKAKVRSYKLDDPPQSPF